MQNVIRIKAAGVEIEVRQSGVDLADMVRAIGERKVRTADLKPVWLGFQPIWYQQNANIFASEGIPPWPRLSPNYLERKLREIGPMPILVYTGRLRSSLVEQTPDSVFIPTARTLRLGTRVPYSRYLQERRPHVELLPETFTELGNLVQDYLTAPIKGVQ